MICKPRRATEVAGLIPYFWITSVAAIDDYANQFHIGADAESGGLMGHLQSKANSEPVILFSDVAKRSHSHVGSNAAGQNGGVAGDAPPPFASSEMECPCAHELQKFKKIEMSARRKVCNFVFPTNYPILFSIQC